MLNDISVLNEWWLVSMPIPMEPQRQAIGNLINLKSHCVCVGKADGSLCRDVPRGVEEEGALLAAVPGAGRVLRRQQQPVPVRPHLDSTARLDHPHVHAHRRHHPLLQGMSTIL